MNVDENTLDNCLSDDGGPIDHHWRQRTEVVQCNGLGHSGCVARSPFTFYEVFMHCFFCHLSSNQHIAASIAKDTCPETPFVRARLLSKARSQLSRNNLISLGQILVNQNLSHIKDWVNCVNQINELGRLRLDAQCPSFSRQDGKRQSMALPGLFRPV